MRRTKAEAFPHAGDALFYAVAHLKQSPLRKHLELPSVHAMINRRVERPVPRLSISHTLGLLGYKHIQGQQAEYLLGLCERNHPIAQGQVNEALRWLPKMLGTAAQWQRYQNLRQAWMARNGKYAEARQREQRAFQHELTLSLMKEIYDQR